MIVAGNTRHGSIPVICVSGVSSQYFSHFVDHLDHILIWMQLFLEVETEAAGPLARVGAGLGSSLTSTLDLFQVSDSRLFNSEVGTQNI